VPGLVDDKVMVLGGNIETVVVVAMRLCAGDGRFEEQEDA
jgi:hypothetical protein